MKHTILFFLLVSALSTGTVQSDEKVLAINQGEREAEIVKIYFEK